ncbi:hypothetical protein OS493_001172 [Desmophyllum pertusum]|uniref:CTHRC1 C-terminal domain-containing protein n=1 Tax=Desmophyllum pertusum TaxID=174260 RepID=A0A9X0D5P6_9CNID|nr:hypothetical protein OS493_001172 [Desmophyllum pertusum]
MIGSGVSLLLWLLAAPLFYQIEGNSTVPSSKLTCMGGIPGRNGYNGLPGRDGRDGVAGPIGSRGVKGEVGQNGADADHRNWKQCVWRSEDRRDGGLVKDCVFNKTKDDTTLRVVYQGNFYVAMQYEGAVFEFSPYVGWGMEASGLDYDYCSSCQQ